MPPDPPSGPKKFFSPLRGTQNFLGTPLKPVKFWAGSAPAHSQTQSIKNSSNAFSLGIASSIWARFTKEEQLKKLSKEELEKLFNNYEAKLSGQMVKSLGKSIINMYSMGACAALGVSNQDALSEDLENDHFLNSALQRFTCELYYRFGSFLAPLSVGLITSRHYLSESNKNGE